MAEEYFISGIESLEYAPASALGVVSDGAWVTIENITDQSVKYTETVAAKTDIYAEDKKYPVFSTYANAAGDVLTLGILSQNPTLEQALYNVDYTPATSTMDYHADKKIANLAFRITSNPANGKKVIRTYFNTEVQTATDGSMTKNDLEKKVLTATLSTYRPAGKTKDYVYRRQVVLADGTIIDETAD